MKNLQGLIAAFIFFHFFPLHLSAQWNADKAVNNPVAVFQGRQEYSFSCGDGAGGAIVAWYDNRGVNGNALYNVYMQRINANGQTQWAAGGISLAVLTSGIGDADIVEDGSGGAVVTFISGSGSSLLILAQRVDANGNILWNSGNPVTVCSAQEAQYHPRIANTGDGFVIVWQDERAGTMADDLYAQKYNSAGVAQWAVNGVVVNAALNNQEGPEIVSIGNGEVIITWDDYRNGTNYDVYAQKLNSAGVRQWTGLDALLSGRIISTAAANQRFPKICTDGVDGAIISWQDFRNGAVNSTDIYAQRIGAAGVVKWATNGVLLSGAPDIQEISDIAFTGNGAVVAWLHYPTTGSYDSYDLWAQKVDTTGNISWAANGVTVCAAADLQNLIKTAADGNGGAFFTWIDRRNGNISNQHIYAQRINSNGLAAWTANGVAVSNSATGSRYNPSLVTSGCSAIFIWEDTRNSCCSVTDVDIYATAFDCDGNIIGSSTGITWTGAISTNWMTPGNWSSNAAPTINDNVTIPSGTLFSPVINNGVLAVCKTIHISANANVTVLTGGDLKVMQ